MYTYIHIYPTVGRGDVHVDLQRVVGLAGLTRRFQISYDTIYYNNDNNNDNNSNIYCI